MRALLFYAVLVQYIESRDESKYNSSLILLLKQYLARIEMLDGIHERTFLSDGKECFLSKCYVNITEDLPVYVRVVNELLETSFGNRLGSLLNDYACAQVSGSHFILIAPQPAESLLGYLPQIVPHQNPVPNMNEAVGIARKICKDNTPYEWEAGLGGSDAFLNPEAIRFVRQLVHDGVAKLTQHLMDIGRFQLPSNVLYTSLVGDDPVKSYPAVSEVTIHYRCSDNIRHPNMGLLPFPAIIAVIPPETKTIYIHTEGTHKEHLCSHIIRALFEDVSEAFPNSLVVAFGKENIYSTIYNFIETNITLICSSSTFCMHAALGKIKGKVFIPPSYYGGKTTFLYQDWHYFGFKTRTSWPANVTKTVQGRRFVIDTLRNLTKYTSHTDFTSKTHLLI